MSFILGAAPMLELWLSAGAYGARGTSIKGSVAAVWLQEAGRLALRCQ